MLNTPPAPWTLHIVDNCLTLLNITHVWTLLNIAHVEHCTSWTLLNIAHIKHCWTLLNIVEHCTCRTLPKHLESPAAQTSPCIQSPRQTPCQKKIFGVIIRQKHCSFFSSFPFLLWVHIIILIFQNKICRIWLPRNQIFQPWQRNKSCLNINDIFQHWCLQYKIFLFSRYMWMSTREKTTHGAGAECCELRANLHPVGRSLAGG